MILRPSFHSRKKWNCVTESSSSHADTRIYVDSGSRATEKFLTDGLRPSTGYPLKTSIKYFGGAAIPGGILLTTKNADTNLGPEGYELTVASNSVVIRAPAQAGLFYGVQTLLQLLPPEIFSSNLVSNVAWQIPCVQIEDWPRFKWRGLMLDVSRHFFTKSEVEAVLDAMVLHKLNTFHWHLTDDQGWRIEIKKYPEAHSNRRVAIGRRFQARIQNPRQITTPAGSLWRILHPRRHP